MKIAKLLPLVAIALTASADETGKPMFAEPVRLKAGDAFLGEGRLYPSPAVFAAEGNFDVVIGDLAGRVTYARRADDGLLAETPMLKRDGKPLKISNW